MLFILQISQKILYSAGRRMLFIQRSTNALHSQRSTNALHSQLDESNSQFDESHSEFDEFSISQILFSDLSSANLLRLFQGFISFLSSRRFYSFKINSLSFIQLSFVHLLKRIQILGNYYGIKSSAEFKEIIKPDSKFDSELFRDYY